MPRGHNVFSRIIPQVVAQSPITGSSINDLFLHALFARIAFSNNDTVEFSTTYDKDTNTIELNVPDEYMEVFDQLTGMQRGEKFQTFMNWLIGSQTLIPASILDTDADFISASNLSIWTGARAGQVEDKIVLYMPAELLSTIGHSAKVSDDQDFTSIQISAVWLYDSGANTSFSLNTILSITDIGVGDVASITSDVDNISTFNLINGDIRETILLSSDIVIPNGSLLNITINRNQDGSTDPQTELVGLLGLKLVLT